MEIKVSLGSIYLESGGKKMNLTELLLEAAAKFSKKDAIYLKLNLRRILSRIDSEELERLVGEK